ncbi:MAG: hypothetical protein J5597_05285 [Spirochaetaceae bacterium]|nr:hypothetical protein [Spirochaetaceae bacterium]
MARQILIECGSHWFEFTKSKTGQLDYAGKIEGIVASSELEGFQCFAGSTYFSPSFYTYISDGMNMIPLIYVADGVDVSDLETYDYLVHVGSLLAAVDSNDSLLAGELYLRRRKTFEKFPQLTQFIMKDLSVEILFSLCFGRMQNINPDDIPLVFNAASEKLGFDPSREDLDQAFMRWFKSNSCMLTLPLVGTNFYNWNSAPEVLARLCDNLSLDDLTSHAEKIRRAKHSFYASLRTTVQAEPYNPHDKNAVLVCIEDIEAKINGNMGLEKAGHIRALAAKVLREAKPKKLVYKSSLASVSAGNIVVKVEV